jgi:hypothetical protein
MQMVAHYHDAGRPTAVIYAQFANSGGDASCIPVMRSPHVGTIP